MKKVHLVHQELLELVVALVTKVHLVQEAQWEHLVHQDFLDLLVNLDHQALLEKEVKEVLMDLQGLLDHQVQ